MAQPVNVSLVLLNEWTSLQKIHFVEREGGKMDVKPRLVFLLLLAVSIEASKGKAVR